MSGGEEVTIKYKDEENFSRSNKSKFSFKIQIKKCFSKVLRVEKQLKNTKWHFFRIAKNRF